MKKVTLLALALGFGLITFAQDSTATKDDTKTKEDDIRNYRSWSVGADFGWPILFGDFHQLEQNKKEYNSDFGDVNIGFSLNLQKWYSSAWGMRARASWLNYSGTEGIYAVRAKSFFKGDWSWQLNLSGIGARNRNKPARKDAWIINAGLGMSWANTIVYKEGKELGRHCKEQSLK